MKKKILLVDDDRLMVKYLSGVLEREGHEVVSAEDGFAALNLLTSYSPNVMFFDLIMPKIDGDKLCQIVSKMPHLRDCYLVILSAAVAELDFDHTKIGADAYIAKGPFETTAKHVLAAIEASSTPDTQDPAKPIKGLDTVYARRLTKELLSRNRHLETILESMSEGIIEIYSRKIVYANSAAVGIIGLPVESIITAYPPDLFDKNLQNQIIQLLETKNDQIKEIGENSPLELNGRMITIKILPVKEDPETIIMLMTDVTERKQLEMRLQHVQKMEAIGTIAAGVAHNFRNTLTEILVNSQVIQMNFENQQGLHDVTARINKSVKRGAQLVDGLLQFSRKQVKKEFHSLDLVQLVKDTEQLIRKSFSGKIGIKTDVPESLVLMGDYAGLHQALMNLCTNARDSMPNGGTLQIQVSKQGNRAMLQVSDSGHGMGKEILDKCFDPFFTTKSVGQGTGLGLSTTYGIIKNHEGMIKVKSEPGKGTKFKISLPLNSSDAKYADNKHQALEPTAEIINGRGESVMVVDDEEDILQAMRDLLDALGYRSILAKSGREALDKYQNLHPDAVLMDVNMPEMDGVSCAERILELDPDANVAFISGYDMDRIAHINVEVKKSIKGFLTKPMDLVRLSGFLKRML